MSTVVWLVGGVDPTGGAGLDRDAATLRVVAPGVVGVRIVTAHTRQGQGTPATATVVSAGAIADAVRGAPPPAAVKVGLVPASVATEVADALAGLDVPVVVDPVLAASAGGTMGATPNGLAPVLAAATVITPNLPEARALLGEVDDLVAAAGRRWPQAWVLLKGGHGADALQVTDVLARGSSRRELTRPRWPGPDPRGTGCALATAIAAGLARGDDVEAAVEAAVAWLDRARRDTVPGPDGRPHLAFG